MIADTGLTILKQPIHDHLQALKQMLEVRITEVNQRITAGFNEHFQIKKRGKWTLQYPRASETVNHPFFDRLRQVDIGDVMHFVNRQCRFMESFKHVLGRYVKQESDDHVLTACLVAWATNMGLGKMGEISDIEYHKLSAISDNFIRLETLSGANEHESHYVFDILFNNTTDIQSEVHSTDTHGTNEVNFAILHLFGYQFAPRYKDIHDTVNQSLYGFKHPSQYGDLLLKPIRKINDNLIISEWENIQRIMVSLALKTTTQSIIVSKLSNYARKNKTRRALWEYDNIIRSLYLLDYVDSPPLRSYVQRALNRGENYHKLRRAVSYANFGKLRFKTEHEQQIWNECSRLITNCIIYYNAAILSALVKYKATNDDEKGVTQLKGVSPVACMRINLSVRLCDNRLSRSPTFRRRPGRRRRWSVGARERWGFGFCPNAPLPHLPSAPIPKSPKARCDGT